MIKYRTLVEITMKGVESMLMEDNSKTKEAFQELLEIIENTFSEPTSLSACMKNLKSLSKAYHKTMEENVDIDCMKLIQESEKLKQNLEIIF